MIFNKDDNYKKIYQKGQDDKERELLPIHQQQMESLENLKNEDIAQLKAELQSMERRMSYWEDIYEKVKAERRTIKREQSELKQDRAEIERVAQDMFYFVNQEVIKNNESLSVMGQILGKFTNKQIKEE